MQACNIDDLGKNMKPKGQQRGQIYYQKWSVLSCRGNPEDVLIKHPAKYKRLLNHQIIKHGN